MMKRIGSIVMDTTGDFIPRSAMDSSQQVDLSSQIVFHLERFQKAAMTVVMVFTILYQEWLLTMIMSFFEMQMMMNMIGFSNHAEKAGMKMWDTGLILSSKSLE